MKKIVSLFLVLGLMSSVAMAETKKKSAPAPVKKAAEEASEMGGNRSGAVPGQPDTDGCGLGWQVTQKKTIIGSITRGTTNSFVPPSFGMTSGTLGCAQHPFAKKDQEAAVYAMTNYDSLNIEMAEGRGEFLTGFARTLGCDDSAMGEFGAMTQAQYKSITEGGKAAPVQMLQNVKQQIRQNAALSAQCNG